MKCAKDFFSMTPSAIRPDGPAMNNPLQLMHTSRTCVTVDLFVLYCGSCSIATPQPRSANRTGQQGQSREYSIAFIVPQDGDRHSPGKRTQ